MAAAPPQDRLLEIEGQRHLCQGQGRKSVRHTHLNASHEVLWAAQVAIASASADALVLPQIANLAHDERHQGVPAGARVRG